MTAKLFITSTCHIKQVLNACMVYLSNQPSFQSYRHCWPIRTDFKACTNLPRSHCLFLFQSKTLDFAFREFQVSAGEGSKRITHSKSGVMGRDHIAVYCLTPAGFAHSRPPETFNETHPEIFFLSRLDRPHFSVDIFSVSLFQLPRTQPETRVNTRMKCDRVTTSKLGSFPLLFSSLYPLLPPSQGAPFSCVFYTRDETAKRGLKPVIKHRCGVLHTDECHHERHFTEVIPANRQFEHPQQQLNSVSPHSSLKRHSGEPSL